MGLRHSILYVLLIILSVEASWFETSPRVDLNFTQLVQFDGYESEWHHVTTSDGYILSVFRVRTRRSCTGDYDRASSKTARGKLTYRELNINDKTYNMTLITSLENKTGAISKIRNAVDNKIRIGSSNERVPILFTHGMYLSGDDCVIPGPQKAHCYLYADACYDVWVFNARGSRYSRNHTTLDPDGEPQYWNFAIDEMALYDLPATIDFILDRTKQKQIAYIGHSQGVAILMLLCIKRPEYNEKIKIGFGLSPIASFSHSRFVIVKVKEILSVFLPWLDRTSSHFEVFGNGKLSQRLSRLFCGQTKLSYPFCSALIFSFIGYNGFDIAPEVLPVLFGHLPSGISAKTFLRWGQIVRNGFSEYDYGVEENLIKYGVEKPPLFDFSKVTMKWALIGSTNDYIADLKDVNITASQLPNALKCVLSDKRVGHLDFIFGKSVVKYIVPMILTALRENKFVCL